MLDDTTLARFRQDLDTTVQGGLRTMTDQAKEVEPLREQAIEALHALHTAPRDSETPKGYAFQREWDE